MMLAVVVLAVVVRRRRRGKALLRAPLAGLDTGVRSPWRVPGKRPHRGF
jgi:hypothetical protein